MTVRHLAATQRDRPRREPARLAISAKDRNAALTAAAFGNSSATSGAMTTTLELARSCSAYFPRTNAPKSERLYSVRSSFATTVLAFLVEPPFCSRRETRGDDPNYLVILARERPPADAPKMKRQRSRTASRRENDPDRRRLPKANHGTRSQLHRMRHHVSVGSRQPFEHSSRSAPGRFTPSSIAVEALLDGTPANLARRPDQGSLSSDLPASG